MHFRSFLSHYQSTCPNSILFARSVHFSIRNRLLYKRQAFAHFYLLSYCIQVVLQQWLMSVFDEMYICHFGNGFHMNNLVMTFDIWLGILSNYFDIEPFGREWIEDIKFEGKLNNEQSWLTTVQSFIDRYFNIILPTIISCQRIYYRAGHKNKIKI